MTPDDMDAAQDSALADQDAAVAAFLQVQAEQERAQRVAQSFRPRVPDALRRCHGCEGAIEPARLKLLPCTGLCAKCAIEAERIIRQEARL